LEFERPETDEDKKVDAVTMAFKLIHHRKPDPGEDIIETAFKIIEVLDDPNFISQFIAREAVHQIMGMRDLKNPTRDKRAEELIKTVESGTIQRLYPELANIDEVHMDQEEAAYCKAKREAEEEVNNQSF
jgi:hypothetical protein